MTIHNVWEFVGMTETEYDEKIFHRRPSQRKCAYPKCKRNHLRTRVLCGLHNEQLQNILYPKRVVDEHTGDKKP